MNILLLHSKLLPSEVRLAEFFKARGCHVLFRDVSECSVATLRGIKVDTVINRVYSRDVAKHAALYQRLLRLIDMWEAHNVRVINGYTSTLCDLNKYMLYKRLSAANINTPVTYLFKTPKELRQILVSLPERAYVIKPACGGCAEHVSRGRSKAEVALLAHQTIADAKTRNYQLGFVLQPFIKTLLPVHYRVQTVGEYYVCCHTRSKVSRGEGEPWLTSANQGSEITYIDKKQLPDDMLDVCRSAVKACDCMVAGIDLLVDMQSKSMVVELNATPFIHAVGIHPRVNEQDIFRQIYLNLKVFNYLTAQHYTTATDEI